MKKIIPLLFVVLTLACIATPASAKDSSFNDTLAIVVEQNIDDIVTNNLVSNETVAQIYEAADRNSVDLNEAIITVYDDGVITFFTPADENDTFEIFENNGLYQELLKGLSVPTKVSPNTSYWEFSGATNNAYLFTNHYLTGYSLYDISLKSTHSSKLVASLRKTSIWLDGSSLYNFTVPGNGTFKVTNIAANKSDKVFIRFGYPSACSGKLSGRN